LGALFDLVRALNRYADREKIESAESGAAARASFAAGMSVLRELTRVLGLFTRAPAHNLAAGADRLSAPLLDLLVSLRAELRQAKNFALADKIRAKLGELGVVLEDRPDGTHWKIEAN
jgi:cysteinyl-tRNA synthetase